MITSSQVREELVTPCNSIWLVLRNLNNNSGIWKYYGAAREAPRRTVFRYRWMTVGEVFRELARLEELVAVDTSRTRELSSILVLKPMVNLFSFGVCPWV